MVVALWAHLLEVADICNRAARDDVGYDLMSGVTGEDHIWSFGVVREHPTDFFAGAYSAIITEN